MRGKISRRQISIFTIYSHNCIGIFAQASKSLDEYRAIIAGQTEQISSLEETLSTTEHKLSQVQAELNTTKGNKACYPKQFHSAELINNIW